MRAYTGNFKKISGDRREDRRVRPVQPGRRVPVEDRVHLVRDQRLGVARVATSTRPPTSQAIVSEVNGTGPYKLDAWNAGSDVTMSRIDNYWGDKAKTAEAHLPLEHRSGPAARRALRRAPSTASTTSGRPTSRPSSPTRTWRSSRARASTCSTSASTTPSRRSTTRRSARRSPWASTASASSTTSIRPAPRSPTTSRRAPSRTAAPVTRGTSSTPPRPRRCSPMRASRTASTRPIHYRDVVRGYLPDPTVVAQDIQAQLKANLDINAKIDVQESGDVHRQRQHRQARWHPPARLGR